MRRVRCLILVALSVVPSFVLAQSHSEALTALDLRRAEVVLSEARARAEQVRALYAEGLTSRGELLRAESELSRAMIEAEKAAVIASNELPAFQVLSAVKVSTANGSSEVHLKLRALPQRYGQVKERQYLVSIANGESIIGEPYQQVLNVGSSARTSPHALRFKLLRDATEVRILIQSGTRREELAVVLQTSADGGDLRLTSATPALEAAPGAVAQFPLRVERFNRDSRMVQFEVLDLPSGFRYSIVDGETGAAVSSLVFSDGENDRKLTLKIFIPDRGAIRMFAEPLKFQIASLRRTASDGPLVRNSATLPLQLVIVGAPDLSLEPDRLLLTLDSSGASFGLSVRNVGPVEAQNVRIEVATPLGIASTARPHVIKSLAPGETTRVTVFMHPDQDAVPGDYAVRVTARALWRQHAVESGEQVIRVSYEGVSSTGSIAGSAGALILIVAAIVWRRRAVRRRSAGLDG